ncbi:MAG: type II secretion system F family protein, partial [Spirochaetales bacterium]|nr:type II secretion system F family protein [Spirochaetales bacterium]
FGSLVHYLKARHSMREKLISALLYPIIVLIVAAAALVLLVVVILPAMEESFGTFGEAGSFEVVFTRIRATALVSGVLLLLTVALVAASAIARKIGGSVASALDRAWLRVPLIGPFAVKARILQLLFALETLVSGGVPLDAALVESGVAVGDHAMRGMARRCAERIRVGMPLSKALAMESVVPTRVARWVQIGERTGNVAAVFSQLRVYYQGENERWSERFMTLVEPALMVLVGAGMILMIVGVVLPLLQAFGGLV